MEERAAIEARHPRGAWGLGVRALLAFGLALFALSACVIGPKPDDPASPTSVSDASPSSDGGGFDMSDSAGGTTPGEVGAASDTGVSDATPNACGDAGDASSCATDDAGEDALDGDALDDASDAPTDALDDASDAPTDALDDAADASDASTDAADDASTDVAPEGG